VGPVLLVFGLLGSFVLLACVGLALLFRRSKNQTRDEWLKKKKAETCSECGGSGSFNDRPCNECDGLGLKFLS